MSNFNYAGNPYNNTYKILRNVYVSGSTSLDAINSSYDAFRAVHSTGDSALRINLQGSTGLGDLEDTLLLGNETSGNDILLTIGDKLLFGDGDSYIIESGDDAISFYTENTRRLRILSSRIGYTVPSCPSSNLGTTLGISSLNWAQMYLGGSIYNGSTEMIDLSDTGTTAVKTTLDLTNGGGVYTDPDLRIGNMNIFDGGSSLRFYEQSTATLFIDGAGHQSVSIKPFSDNSSIYTLGTELRRWYNINLSDGIYNGTTQMIDLSDTGTTAIKTDLSIEGGKKLYLDGGNDSYFIGEPLANYVYLNLAGGTKFQFGPTEFVTNITTIRPSADDTTSLGLASTRFKELFLNPVSGDTKAGAGAATGQVWVTSNHATLPDGVLMLGI